MNKSKIDISYINLSDITNILNNENYDDVCTYLYEYLQDIVMDDICNIRGYISKYTNDLDHDASNLVEDLSNIETNLELLFRKLEGLNS